MNFKLISDLSEFQKMQYLKIEKRQPRLKFWTRFSEESSHVQNTLDVQRA